MDGTAEGVSMCKKLANAIVNTKISFDKISITLRPAGAVIGFSMGGNNLFYKYVGLTSGETITISGISGTAMVELSSG